MTLEGDTLIQIQNGGMPFVPPSSNIYQQKISGRHTNISQNIIMNYLPGYSHWTRILSWPHQKKTINNSQEHSEFIFAKDDNNLPLKNQNHMSNSLPT